MENRTVRSALRWTLEPFRHRDAYTTLLVIVIGIAVVAMSGCLASSSKPATPQPAGDIDLSQAAAYVAGDLSRQLGPVSERRLAVDPLLDRASGQQTGTSLAVQRALIAALRNAMSTWTVEALDADASEQRGLVATGTVGPGSAQDFYVVNVALTDRISGVVVAQAAARFRQLELDAAPTPFYTDSPSLVRDRSVDGYLRTAEIPAGNLADPLYVEQLPTAALIATALEQYNSGNWDAALAGYTAAAARENGQNLRTFNGLYLTNMRLGRPEAAEEAFGRIAALGLATNNLAVKLLFRPGTTEFLADPSLGGTYPMWIRQIARAAQASQACLNITGHTSASGTAAVNERLSLARATAVQSLLVREVPNLQSRTRVTGVGSRRNLVGTGADDASDAIDRRVEFEVEACR